MPQKQLPEDAAVGDSLEVFIYRDSKDRLIATTRKPLALVGELAYLKVTAKTKFGAFLDMGLERGLFLPFSEQRYAIEINKSYLVYLYLDKSKRICCTTDVYKYLTADSPYRKNDQVKGTVYLVKPELGILVAVDDRFKGLIPPKEFYTALTEGDRVEARVIRVREDGKLDLSLRELAYIQRDKDEDRICRAMAENHGWLAVDEKSSPEKIKEEFQISKAAFKRAIGGLLKTGKIIKTEKGFKLKEI